MPNQSNTSSHCVVQWEDDNEQYAIVDTKRSKAVATLKVGMTTLFEGYQRERRRGKILHLGSKKDCFSYGFDTVDDDSQLNTYSWSSPPGLREQLKEVAKPIHGGAISLQSLRGTTSSSSTNSSGMVKKQQKQKKIQDKVPDNIGEPITVDDQQSMEPPSSTSTVSLIETSHFTVNNICHKQLSTSGIQLLNNQSSTSDKQSLCNQPSNSTMKTTTEKHANSASVDDESLLKENEELRKKNLLLQEEILSLRQTSAELPDEQTYTYFKNVCLKYEQTKDKCNTKAIELGSKLPCSSVELKSAKKLNPAATINNLIKYCFKDIDLKTMSYEKLKAINGDLLEQIRNYVQHIHAPTIIPPKVFSATISLKCRHLRSEDAENKGVTPAKKHQKKKNQISKRLNNNYGNVNHQGEDVESFDEPSAEDMDENKENIDDTI